MTVYYQDALVTLYHGDCLDLADKWTGADVLVTDPPYGMAYISNHNTLSNAEKRARAVAGDETVDVRDKALKAWGDGPALVFGKWNCDRPSGVRHRLIWSKGDDPGMGDLGMPWGNSDEEVYVLGSGFVGKRGSNVITALKPPVNSRPNHPTPKPVALMERLLEKCPPGVVADPFAGSGSTLVAAVNQGRKVIGVEFEERYCELIANRLSNQTATLDFGGVS